jgi:hypothetical protein
LGAIFESGDDDATSPEDQRSRGDAGGKEDCAAGRVGRRDGPCRRGRARCDVDAALPPRRLGRGLRLATLDSILLDIRPPFGDGSAAEQLRGFALQARSAMRRYPGAADAVLTSWPELVQGCRLMEWLRFPQLVELQSGFARLDTERHFAVGLDALFDGLLSGSKR